MNNKELISSALLEIAKRSETTFLEVGEDDKELIDAAKKVGIVLPSPDLLLFKTIYAEIDRVNLNGVILPRKAVEEGLPTLVGKNLNWEHEGSGRICGFCISASINDDKIETINVIFKSLFPDEIDELREKIKTKEAAVSFEIWNVSPDTRKSVVKELSDGNYSIDPIIFHGTGVLLVNPPACPRAKLFKMIGKCEAIDLKKIEDKSFTEDLVFAHMAIEEPKCLNCENCTCEKEVKIVEEIKKEEEIKPETALEVIPEAKVEEKKEEIVAEKAEEIIPETKVEEIKVEAEVTPEEVAKTTPEETKVEAEVKPEVVEEVVKEEVPAEVKAEDAQVVVKTQEIVVTDEIKPDVEVRTTEVKSETKSIDDSGKETVVIVREEKTVETFTREQLDEAVNAVKAEKDAEIEKLKQELAVAKQPKEIVKASEEEITQADLTVGEVNPTGEDLELKRQKDNVNSFIASKHKK